MTSSDVVLRARSIGAAARRAMSAASRPVRVHSVFRSVVNLELDEPGYLVALTGPAGVVYPHAIALDREVDFRELRGRTVRIDLRHATTRPHRTLPSIGCRHDCDRCALAAAASSVPSLIGLGAGLTPAGDDFACGFLAAARVRSCDIVGSAVARSIEQRLERTGDVSASMLRWILLDYWPEPLVDMAGALASGNRCGAERALEALCALGHTSGADIASGFVYAFQRTAPGVPGKEIRSSL